MDTEILEWCGFRVEGKTTHYYTFNGKPCDPPALDMNFFFKYVVPKLLVWTMNGNGDTTSCMLMTGFEGNQCAVSYEVLDPNQAWQEALLKLIEGERWQSIDRKGGIERWTK